MTVSELDTFYFKFKNLVLAEKNTILTLKSEAGRTDVTLSVDLDNLLADADPQQPHRGRKSLPEEDDVNAEQQLFVMKL